MHYADTHACPACRGAIDGQPRCPHCQFDLAHASVPEIWRHLTALDRLIAEARTAPVPAPIAAAPAPTPAPPVAPAPVSPSSGGLTTGSVLLGLGAAFLVVAGTIFVSFAWSVVGIGGRAAILALVTAAAGGATVWAARRGLRGSAEALGVVTAGLTLADVVAAWGAGLLGLDGAPAWVVCGLLTMLLLAFALAVVPAGRPRLDADLVSVQVAIGLALLPTVVAVTQAVVEVGGRLFWALLVAALVPVAVGLVGLIARQSVTAVLAFGLAAVTLLVAAAAAVVEAVTHPGIAELAGELRGLPLLTLVMASAGAAAWRPARTGAVTLAVVLAATLVALPLGADLAPEAVYLWGAGLVVVLALATGRDAVSLGLRLAGAPIAVIVALSSLAWQPRVAQAWTSGWDDPLDASLLRRTEAVAEAPAPGWVVLLGLGALAAAVVLAMRWDAVRPHAARRHLPAVAALLAIAAALAALASVEVPVVTVAGLVLAAGVLFLPLARTGPHGWDAAPVVLLAVAPTAVLASRDALALLALAAAAALAAACFALRLAALRAVTAGVAAAWTLGAVALLVTRPGVGLDADWRVTVLLVMAVATTVAAAVLQRWPVLVGVEVAGAVAAGLTTAVGTGLAGPGWQAAWWTVIGVAATAVGLLVAARRWYRFVGAAALGLAWVLRLVASDVEVVEAYTAPFAGVALLVGAWAMHRDPRMGTFRALGAGLTLALLPSLPQALADPLSWRALALGVLAVVALAVGTWRHWQAPFLAGAGVLALLVLVELGPLALAVPRWILIGLAGVVLLVGGITWEDRARDGRAAARFVRSMR